MQLKLHLFCLFFTLIIKRFRRTEKVSVLRNLKNQANLPARSITGIMASVITVSHTFV